MRLRGHNSFFAEDQFNGRLWHQVVDVIRKTGTSCVCVLYEEFRADFRLAPKHWETSLQCNAVSHWFGANLESALRFRTWALLRGAHVSQYARNHYAWWAWSGDYVLLSHGPPNWIPLCISEDMYERPVKWFVVRDREFHIEMMASTRAFAGDRPSDVLTETR